jgi:hypothetical protein
MSYVIIKEVKSMNGQVLPVILLDSHSDVMEFETEERADSMAEILNVNSDSGHIYRVRKVGTPNK